MPKTQSYAVALLYAEPPTIDRPALLERINPQEAGSANPAHLELTLTTGPALISQPGGPLDPDLLEKAVSQSWDYPDAASAVALHKGYLLVGQPLEAFNEQRGTALATFHALVQAVADVAPPVALLWRPSARIVDYARYTASKQEGDILYPAINVRLFTGEDGSLLMDTLGLNSFALPDLQCRYTDIEPREVASLLLSYATYLFQQGDVIQDGDTLTGLVEGRTWLASRTPSAVTPPRETITLTL